VNQAARTGEARLMRLKLTTGPSVSVTGQVARLSAGMLVVAASF
jgi:hypothetical protein